MNELTATELLRRSARVTDGDVGRLVLAEALDELIDQVATEPRDAARRGRPLEARRPMFRATRWALTTLLIVTALAITAAAVPQVRAAIDDLTDTLSGYLDDDDPPGRPLESSDDAPAWLRSGDQTGQRVIARAEGHALYLSHDAEGGVDATYNFLLDGSVGIGDTASGWERELSDSAVHILGRTGGARTTERVPLFGITAGSVVTVELHYYGGGKETAPAETGGFVLMMDPYGRPGEIVALDAAGNVLETLNAVNYGNTAEPGEKPEQERVDPDPDEIVNLG